MKSDPDNDDGEAQVGAEHDAYAPPYHAALQADELADGPLLRPAEVEAITTLDQKTIDRLVRDERFPAPLQLSDRRRAWRRRDLRRWLADPFGWVSF